ATNSCKTSPRSLVPTRGLLSKSSKLCRAVIASRTAPHATFSAGGRALEGGGRAPDVGAPDAGRGIGVSGWESRPFRPDGMLAALLGSLASMPPGASRQLDALNK